MSNRNKRQKIPTEHHALPQSRFPEYRNEGWNKRNPIGYRHEAWHELTCNKTPCEAIIDLLQEFGTRDLAQLALDPGLPALKEFLKSLPKTPEEAARAQSFEEEILERLKRIEAALAARPAPPLPPPVGGTVLP